MRVCSRLLPTLVLAVFTADNCFADDNDVIKRFEKSIQQAIGVAEPAVACIYVNRRDSDGERADGMPEYFGTGIVIDHRLVLTCYHVVRDAKSIFVRLPPLKGIGAAEGLVRSARAEIYAADNRSDLAVLRLDRDFDAPPIEIGRGEDLQKGSLVVSVSHGFLAGFRDGSATASWGIVSNFRRRLPGSPHETDRPRTLQQCAALIQTDARIQLGGSGGALVDLNGKLVAVASAQAALSGSETTGGYALPIDAGVRRIIERLRKGEEVEYGFLGVSSSVDRGFPRRTQRTGVMIDSVTANSPAAHAGLRPGDLILSIDGRPVRDFDDLFLHIGLALAGREANLQVQRTGFPDPVTFKPILAKAANPDFGIAMNRPTPIYGLRVEYTSILGFAGRQAMPDGVLVRDIAKGSPAEAAQLSELNDVITEINGVRVANPAEFYREAEKATRANRPLKLKMADPPRQVVLP